MTEDGSAKFEQGTRRGVGVFNVANPDIADARIETTGYYLDDEQSQIEMQVTVAGVTVTASLAVDEALAVADDIETAAAEIEEVGGK